MGEYRRSARGFRPPHEKWGAYSALLAGPDAVRAAGFTPDAAICAGVGLHSKTVAEHALALTLNFVRFLPTLAQATAEHRWAEELGGAQELHPKDQVTTLLDANVLSLIHI